MIAHFYILIGKSKNKMPTRNLPKKMFVECKFKVDTTNWNRKNNCVKCQIYANYDLVSLTVFTPSFSNVKEMPVISYHKLSNN